MAAALNLREFTICSGAILLLFQGGEEESIFYVHVKVQTRPRGSLVFILFAGAPPLKTFLQFPEKIKRRRIKDCLTASPAYKENGITERKDVQLLVYPLLKIAGK